MGVDPSRQWTRRIVLLAVLGAAACSSPPTGPSTATPTATTTPNVAACTAAQPLTTFAASPSTITVGDSFTLNWTAPCGFVSLALTGQTPFITLQPSTGSYQVRSGEAGYPAAMGDISYEAKNGDTATPFRTTVTMKPVPTPTPVPCPPGNVCNDGNACTSSDRCQSDGSTCRGTVVSCNDNDPCTDDSCNTVSGCRHSAHCSSGQDCHKGSCYSPCDSSNTPCQVLPSNYCDTHCGCTCTEYSCWPPEGGCSPEPTGTSSKCSACP
jgi:hypothetical protein